MVNGVMAERGITSNYFMLTSEHPFHSCLLLHLPIQFRLTCRYGGLVIRRQISVVFVAEVDLVAYVIEVDLVVCVREVALVAYIKLFILSGSGASTIGSSFFLASFNCRWPHTTIPTPNTTTNTKATISTIDHLLSPVDNVHSLSTHMPRWQSPSHKQPPPSSQRLEHVSPPQSTSVSSSSRTPS